jgi:hypothetical protein
MLPINTNPPKTIAVHKYVEECMGFRAQADTTNHAPITAISQFLHNMTLTSANLLWCDKLPRIFGIDQEIYFGNHPLTRIDRNLGEKFTSQGNKSRFRIFLSIIAINLIPVSTSPRVCDYL